MNHRAISIILFSLFSFSILLVPLTKIVDDRVDVSMLFSLDEEEKPQKEINPSVSYYLSDQEFILSVKKKGEILQKESLYSFLHYNEFLQPPEHHNI